MEGVILTYFIYTFLRLSYYLSSANTYLSSYNLIAKTAVFSILALVLTFQQAIINNTLIKLGSESEASFVERKIQLNQILTSIELLACLLISYKQYECEVEENESFPEQQGSELKAQEFN